MSLFLPKRNDEYSFYSIIRDNKNYVQLKEELELLWEMCKKCMDPNFQIEMQENEEKFFQRLWELRTAYHLIYSGKSLSEKKASIGLDFLINGEKKIWVECITPTNGEKYITKNGTQITNPNFVPEIEFEELKYDPNTNKLLPLKGPGFLEPAEQIKLRYTSAIHDKYKDITKQIDTNIIDKTEPVVIAINSSLIDQDWEMGEFPNVVKVCFGIGQLRYTIMADKITHDIIGHEATYTDAYTINKSKPDATNANIDSAIFMSSTYPYISAIIFSYSKESKKPFHIIHNPLAINPLAENLGCEFEYKLQDIEKNDQEKIIKYTLLKKIYK